MNEARFNNRDSLKAWLMTATGLVMTSVSLVSDVQNLEIQFSNPKALYNAIDWSPIFIPEGEYLVNYKEGDTSETEDIDYSKQVMVISLEARFTNSTNFMGGLRPLITALSDFKYSCTFDRTNPAYIIASLWVVEPKNIVEVEKLKDLLEKNAILYAFNDGTGELSTSNLNFGNGISQAVKNSAMELLV